MCAAVPAACWACCANAAAQDRFDRDDSARDYVQFLVLQLDQWSKEFPQQFYAALMRPPVDASKLSETAKAGAGELGESIKRLATLSSCAGRADQRGVPEVNWKRRWRLRRK